MDSMKQKAITGIIWSSIERFSLQGVQFIFQILIARILSPADYGIIAMLAIFMAVSQTVVDSGFENALIRKTDRTDVDYCTVFFFNIIISLLFYCLLFLGAPAIANLYRTPALAKITKVYMLLLPINALAAIQRTQLVIDVNFKGLAKASLLSAFISGVLGLVLAFQGFGYWSIVCSSLANAIINAIVLWFVSKWRPSFKFSVSSLRVMFSFGSKILLSGLLDTIYSNLYQFVIGRRFSKADLGYYARAVQFAQFPSLNITGILQRVTYPILCTMANDEKRLVTVFRRFIRLSAFIVFPLMIGLAAVSRTVVYILLGEKWLFSATILQIVCFAYIWYPIHAINLNVLMVKGRSDLFFRVEIIKKILGVTILLFVMQFNIIVMAVGTIAASVISLFINTFYSKKMIGYKLSKQLFDLIPTLIVSLVSCIPALVISINYSRSIGYLLISVLTAVVMYIVLSRIFLKEDFNSIFNIVKRELNKYFGRIKNE